MITHPPPLSPIRQTHKLIAVHATQEVSNRRTFNWVVPLIAICGKIDCTTYQYVFSFLKFS